MNLQNSAALLVERTASAVGWNMRLSRLFRNTLFLGVLVSLTPLTLSAQEAAEEFFYPDRERGATFGEGDDLRVTVRLRPGRGYRVVRRNRNDSQVLVEAPGNPEVVGWVRPAPAEMVVPEEGLATPYYSAGWGALYRDAADLQDDELEDYLRRLNKNSRSLGYSKARTVMYSSLDNRDGWLTCVYTGLRFPAGNRPGNGPGGKTMNCEHTWPQGSFDKAEPMRSDIHHLYPTETRSNGIRGSKPFQELDDDEGQKVGEIGARTTRDAFEPPQAHKGNVARALLYFAVMYKKNIPSFVEEVLREWSEQDPVDEAERSRNAGIYAHQNNRNFFVDHPELISRIQDF